MKNKLLIGLIIFTFLLAGCKNSILPLEDKTAPLKSFENYYTLNGTNAILSDNYMVTEEKGLKIIDLNTKKTVKSISLQGNYAIGYDMYGTKLVWSDFASKYETSKDPSYDERVNTDIYLYDMKADKVKKITTNSAGQIHPKIWENYIVWQDNRNDKTEDKNPEWDIYLYNIDTNEEKLITTAQGIHTNPSINDNKVVWEDGRNFKGKEVLRWGENVPENNTDIYMYDIKTGKETPIATGLLQECKPTIYGSHIAWEDRNNAGFAAEIYLYDLNKKEKIRITKDKYDQRDPKLFNKYLVWMDERRGASTNDVIINGKKPNSDIYLYDIENKKEYLITGDEPQIMPSISENYITYITSRQINAEINVIKYR